MARMDVRDGEATPRRTGQRSTRDLHSPGARGSKEMTTHRLDGSKRGRRLLVLAGVMACLGATIARGQTAVTTSSGTYQNIEFDLLSSFNYEMPDPLDPAAKPAVNLLPRPVLALTA